MWNQTGRTSMRNEWIQQDEKESSQGGWTNREEGGNTVWKLCTCCVSKASPDEPGLSVTITWCSVVQLLTQ